MTSRDHLSAIRSTICRTSHPWRASHWSPRAFSTHEETLRVLGNAVHLSADAGLTSVYDTALFGFAWSTLVGFYHAVALTENEGVAPQDIAAVASSHLPFLGRLIREHADQIATRKYPNHDGTLEVHEAAMDHLTATSRQQSVATDVPDLLRSLIRQAIARGNGNNGIASVAEVIKEGAGLDQPAEASSAPQAPGP